MGYFSMVLNNYHWDIFTCGEDDFDFQEENRYGFTDSENLEVYIRTEDIAPDVLARTVRRQLTDMYMISYGYDKAGSSVKNIGEFVSVFLPNIMLDSQNILESVYKDDFGFDEDDQDLIDISSIRNIKDYSRELQGR